MKLGCAKLTEINALALQKDNGAGCCFGYIQSFYACVTRYPTYPAIQNSEPDIYAISKKSNLQMFPFFFFFCFKTKPFQPPTGTISTKKKSRHRKKKA